MASTSGNWRSGPGRAPGSSRDGTACRRDCRGRPRRSPARHSRRRPEPASARVGVEMVGMDEIGVQPVVAGRDAVEQRMRAVSRESCSSRSAESSAPGRLGVISFTSPAIQPKPLVTVFSRPRSDISCMPTQMPRKGLASLDRRLVDRLPHAGDGARPAAAIGIGADAGQHDAVGARAPARHRR